MDTAGTDDIGGRRTRRQDRLGRLVGLGAAVALIVTVAGCGADADDGADAGATTTTAAVATEAAASADAAAAQPVQDLYVVDAAGVRAELDDDGSGATLTLDGVDDDVLVFTDRPERQSSWTSTDVFFDGWDASGFTDVPPNAAIVAPDAPPGARPAAVELTEPRYDAASGELTVRVDGLEGSHLDWLSLLADTDSGPVTLFIDSADEPVGSYRRYLHVYLNNVPAGSDISFRPVFGIQACASAEKRSTTLTAPNDEVVYDYLILGVTDDINCSIAASGFSIWITVNAPDGTIARGMIELSKRAGSDGKVTCETSFDVEVESDQPDEPSTWIPGPTCSAYSWDQVTLTFK